MIRQDAISLSQFKLVIDLIGRNQGAQEPQIFTRQQLIDTYSEIKRERGLTGRSSPWFMSHNDMTHDSKKERNRYDLSIFKLSTDEFARIKAQVAAGNKDNEYYLTHNRINAIPELTSKIATPTRLENRAEEPGSRADADLEQTAQIDIERSAGFQSNPKIRQAIEDYAMRWAERELNKAGLKPQDKSKTKSYDFLCSESGAELYVEVKGTQANGNSVSLTPKEVEHAREHKNSALFIVHSVKVKGKRSPIVSRGKEVFLNPWDISKGTLKPRGYVLTLSKADASGRR
jgi:hypothetical protein